MHQYLKRTVDRIAAAYQLDAPAAALQAKLVKPLGTGQRADLLRGKPLGHAVHPALVAVPIGVWLSASVLDLTGGDAAAARRLTAVGCLIAMPTAAAGGSAGLRTDGADRRIGLVHGAINDLALMVYFESWRRRRAGRRSSGAALSLAGAGLLTVSGWLGAHLAHGRGVGVGEP